MGGSGCSSPHLERAQDWSGSRSRARVVPTPPASRWTQGWCSRSPDPASKRPSRQLRPLPRALRALRPSRASRCSTR